MGISLFILSMILWVDNNTGSGLQGMIAVVAILTYVSGFSIGLGGTSWVGKEYIMMMYIYVTT